MKQYRVHLKGSEQRQFTLPGGRYLTLKDGAILPEGNEFVNLYPSFCKEMPHVENDQSDVDVDQNESNEDQLLNEDPIAPATIASDDSNTDVDQNESNEDQLLNEDASQNESNEDASQNESNEDTNELSFADIVAACETKEQLNAIANELGIKLDNRKDVATMKEMLIAASLTAENNAE